MAANTGVSGSEAKALAANNKWSIYTFISAISNDLTKNNSSYFTALPGGSRDYYNNFNSIGENGSWWSSTISGAYSARYRYLYSFNGGTVERNFNNYGVGYSVRCLRDK